MVRLQDFNSYIFDTFHKFSAYKFSVVCIGMLCMYMCSLLLSIEFNQA